MNNNNFINNRSNALNFQYQPPPFRQFPNQPPPQFFNRQFSVPPPVNSASAQFSPQINQMGQLVQNMPRISPQIHQMAQIQQLGQIGQIGQIQTQNLAQIQQINVQNLLNNGQLLNNQQELEKTKYFNFQTKFIATHKDVVNVATFSRDGTLAATGSNDMSIKLLDVSKMHFHNQAKSSIEFCDDFVALKPVIRTFYDNDAKINDLDFHPTATLLISCSDDKTLKFFDHEKMIVKKAYNTIKELFSIKSINFHPNGEYILSGGENPFIRIINVQNFKVFVSKDIENQHDCQINKVRYNIDGRLYASCSEKGDVKFWNGATNSCIKTLKDIHSNKGVFAVSFSNDDYNFLTCGADSFVRLWDLRTYKEIWKINGCNPTSNAEFFDMDTTVLCSKFATNSISAHDLKTGEEIREFNGHTKPIQWLAGSPSEPAFISGGTDCRSRFWAEDF